VVIVIADSLAATGELANRLSKSGGWQSGSGGKMGIDSIRLKSPAPAGVGVEPHESWKIEVKIRTDFVHVGDTPTVETKIKKRLESLRQPIESGANSWPMNVRPGWVRIEQHDRCSKNWQAICGQESFSTARNPTQLAWSD